MRIVASIALNDEWWVSQSVRYVGIELLGQVKRGGVGENRRGWYEKYGMKRAGDGMNDDIKAMVPSITHHFASLWPRTDRTTFS